MISNTERRIIVWLSGTSAGLTAIAGVVTAYPGDIVSQGVTLGLLAGSAGLAALIAIVTNSGQAK